MNQPSDMLFTFALPIVLALVIGFVLASRWIPERHRRTIERAIASVIYPAAVAVWALQAYEQWSEGDWLHAGVMMIATVFFAVLGATAIRQGRLAPVGERRE